MRINLEQTLYQGQLIYDTYPHDLKALERVLTFANQQLKYHTKPITLVLTDLNDLGNENDTPYKQIATLLTNQQVNTLVALGPQLTHHANLFKIPQTHFYPNLITLLNNPIPGWNNHIIIKNNPKYDLIPLYNHLNANDHTTLLEINLDTIAQNLQFFKNKLKPSTQIIAMVKAQAYGSSHFELAQFLQTCQVDYFAVCYSHEGVILRRNGIKLPIMVMNPTIANFDTLSLHQLEPVLYSLSTLEAWCRFSIYNQPPPCHIKLDTGMHRLGIMPTDKPVLFQLLHYYKDHLNIKSICSHLAAPTLKHASYTHKQASLFQEWVLEIEQKLGRNVLKHLTSTNGSYYFPTYQYDMVRIGIGLYGINMSHLGLTASHTFKTTVAQLKKVPAGASIGYECEGIAFVSTDIAILNIGYADGFRRSLGNGQGKVQIKGQIASVIGNVCMDMVMVNVTGLDVQEGDEVIIFGPEWPIEKIMEATKTIAHEILTNVGPRVRRIYFTTS